MKIALERMGRFMDGHQSLTLSNFPLAMNNIRSKITFVPMSVSPMHGYVKYVESGKSLIYILVVQLDMHGFKVHL